MTPETGESSIRKSAWPSITVILILTAAAGLRWYRIGEASVWVDEIASLMFSTGRPVAQFDPPADVIVTPGHDLTGLRDAKPLSAVWFSSRDDTHPPLHAVALRFWRAAFGGGDVAARSLSLAFSVLSIFLLFDAVRLLHGRAAALWAAAVMAIASPQIEFAQEIRGYSMMVCLTLAMIAAVVRIEKLGVNWRRLAALGAACWAATMTHYAALPVDVAVSIYILLRLRARARMLSLGALAIAGLLFVVTWGPILWGQRQNFGENLGWIADDRVGLIGRTLARLAGLPLRFFITPMTRDRASVVGSFAAIFYVVPIVLLIAARRRDLLLWCLVGGAVIAGAAASDVIAGRRSLEQLRFTLAAAPAAYALAAAMTATLQRAWLRHVVPAACVLACALALPEAYNRYWKPKYREFAAELDRVAGPDDVIVANFESQEQDWYQPALVAALTRYSRYANRPMLVLSKPIDDSIRRQLASAPGAWFVSGNAESPPIDRFVPESSRTGLVGDPHVGSATKLRVNVNE